MRQTQRCLVWLSCRASRAAVPDRASLPGWWPSGCSLTCPLLRRTVPELSLAPESWTYFCSGVSHRQPHPTEMAPGEVFSDAIRFCFSKRSTLWAFPWNSVCWVFWPYTACSLCQPLSRAFDSSLAVCRGRSGISASLSVAIAGFQLPRALQQRADTASWNSHGGVTGGSVSPHQLVC